MAGPIVSTQELLKLGLNHYQLRRLFEDFIDADNETGQLPPASTKDLIDDETEIAGRLERDGFSTLQMLDPQQASETVEFLKSQPVYDGHYSTHSKGTRFPSYDAASGLSYVHYDHEAIMNAPHIREQILESPRYYRISKAYLREDPALYSLGCFWSLPTNEPHPFSQYWHRDFDDIRFSSIFMFLSDVDREEDGPHCYLKGTHTSKLPEAVADVIRSGRRRKLQMNALMLSLKNGLRRAVGNYGRVIPAISETELLHQKNKVHPIYAEIMRDSLVTVYGKAGDGFIEDPGGIHLGVLPRSKPRLIFWMRYGLNLQPIMQNPVASG